MNQLLGICLVICLLTILGYIWGKMTLGTVAACSMMLFLLTGCISAKDALGNIGNSNVIMVLSMFVVSAGFNKTQFVKMIGQSVNVLSKGSITKVMFGFIFASVLAATLTGSAAAAFCIMAPIVAASCEELHISPSRVTFCVGLTCIAACGIIPVGGSLAMFAELNGYITANDYEQYQLAVTDLFKGRWMSLVALIIYCVFIGYRFSPEKPVLKMENGTDLAAKNKKTEVLSPAKERCGYLLFFLVSLALIFNTQLNAGLQAVGLAPLASWEIVLAGAVLMVVSGVLSSKEAFAAVPWDLGFLIAGSLCMGSALANTGGGDLIGGAIAAVAGNLGNRYLVGAVFYLVPFFLTQIMQNRTVMATFQPIAILACKSMGVNCVGPVLLVASACCTAFMTPMATACVPMIMDIGGYDVKSQLKQSVLPAVILSVVNIFWVMTVYPF